MEIKDPQNDAAIIEEIIKNINSARNETTIIQDFKNKFLKHLMKKSGGKHNPLLIEQVLNKVFNLN